MTHSMGVKGWNKESWPGRGGGRRRRSSMEQAGTSTGTGTQTGTGMGSEVSSLTDYSLERSNTHDTAPSSSFLLQHRELSTLSSHVDNTSYQEKLQGWSAVFHHDNNATVLAPRPGTSLNNPSRSLTTAADDIQREFSFLQANGSAAAFPAKPRELHDPLDGMLPSTSSRHVAQRKYYVLPSIGGHQNDFILRRQHSNVETLNQLDYARENYEGDAEFFAELMELKRESCKSSTPHPQMNPPNHPLPPIQRLKDVVRPRTNIAELDEDHYAFSGKTSPSAMSVISDVEQFRGHTPEPDYADTSPRKASCRSQVVRKSTGSRRKSLSEYSVDMVDQMDDESDDEASIPDANYCDDEQNASR